MQIECRLCLTVHNNEGNYLAHTQVRQSRIQHTQLASSDAQLLIKLPRCHVCGAAGLTAPLLRAAHHHRQQQGKRHQQNLAKRAAREAAEMQAAPAPNRRVQIKKSGERHQAWKDRCWTW